LSAQHAEPVGGRQWRRQAARAAGSASCPAALVATFRQPAGQRR